jgi:alkylation response protein AidB-like acyl-CoA dehydrogenase
VDFRDTPEEAAFRAELRSWLRDNLPADWAERPPHVGNYDEDFLREWSGRLYDAGYVGITWPTEYGGRGLGHTFQGIFLEESARAGAPPHLGGIGLGMAGPTIIAWGTHEQKARYLKPLLRGDEVWCQHIADWCILVVRTDREAPKHAGLSYLLVDMKAPGVDVRPLRQITGDPEFNEIFFSDVRVPKASILGNPGDGWKVAMTTLLHERGTLGFALTARLEVAVDKLIALAQLKNPDGSRAADDPLIRDAVAQSWIDLQSLRYTNYSSLTSLVKTGVPGPEGSVAKLHWSEANQRITKLALSIEGLASQLDGAGGVWDGYWQYEQLRSRGNTIEAGTSEILRNIIAERVVGLPKSR